MRQLTRTEDASLQQFWLRCLLAVWIIPLEACHLVLEELKVTDGLGDAAPGLIKACYYLQNFSGSSHIFYQHQDYLGTERYRTNANGGPESYFWSQAYGDSQVTGGSDVNSKHFALTESDATLAGNIGKNTSRPS